MFSKILNWDELTDYVGRPVYQAGTNTWHILYSYKEYMEGTKRIREVYLSDVKGGINFESIVLKNTDRDAEQFVSNLGDIAKDELRDALKAAEVHPAEISEF